ncbi:MAG TPA: hypothetical protein VNY05_18890, partial [Candidatus Acidoferrales bacterium]|nr:hypothetical protein [Candidatus Acidoferrales bacterium]
PSCSRKWMSGPADAWAQRAEGAKDRVRHVVALIVGWTVVALVTYVKSAGRSLFSLDKTLSWMSHFGPTIM